MTTYPGQMHYMQIILPRRTRRRRRWSVFIHIKVELAGQLLWLKQHIILQMQEKGITAWFRCWGTKSAQYFYDKVNDEINGVQYGTIEYLYRKVIQGSEDVRINDIFCSLQLKNVSGEIFVMPALKSMNKDYVYQIERLQTQQIQEKMCLEKYLRTCRKNWMLILFLIDTSGI